MDLETAAVRQGMNTEERATRLNARLRIARQGIHEASQWLEPAADQPTPNWILESQRREALSLLNLTMLALDRLEEKDPIEHAG